ncbi:hypothetical protein QBC34DRAFT_381921 [Podospora aff. communis PSN243]|uniref:F-box domain-containing protein n=1 Tax=Podospora aff. communis PSN243 TaxID=3040156 RepID=A0AAV9GKD3_9PEZI|nr:hypothetical protein QBC34DRAFT_381921 [Podospora aff. communis PSN243]
MDSLPTELLLEIPHHLTSTSDLASLARTSKRLNLIINPLLYQRDVKSRNPISPFWAAERGLIGTLRYAQAAGADLLKRRDFCKPRSEYGPHWQYVEPAVTTVPGGASPRKRRSMSSFLDGSAANPLPRYWWRPLDVAAFFGQADTVQFLVEEVEGADVLRSRSRGLCAFAMPRCGRSGVEASRRLESEWTVHDVMELASCGGHHDVAELLRELASAPKVEKMQNGWENIGKGTERAAERSGKGASFGVEVAEVPASEVEFSYRDFVLERF